MKLTLLTISILLLSFSIFYTKSHQQCIPVSGGFVTEICYDENYANNVRFTFTGGATQVYWSFGFKEDTFADRIERLLNSIK